MDFSSNLFQKIGFLYVEQAFVEGEEGYQRRVVLAVCCDDNQSAVAVIIISHVTEIY